MTNSNLLNIDEAKMYVGKPFSINSKITIYQPKVGEIINFGERQYFNVVQTITGIPSDMKSRLDDIGINYMEISDFELFMLLHNSFDKDSTKLIFGDIDLSSFKYYVNNQNGKPVLYDEANDIVIDEHIYMKIMEYIRKVHNLKQKIEKAANETTRKLLIQLDRDRIKRSQNEPYCSQLKKLLSAMMRYPGCCMTLAQLLELPLYTFMDLVEGSKIYTSSTALLQGSYNGMIDCSKINKKEFNWMRSLDD